MNLERWTYNKRTGICEYFKYGGCGASGNIFEDWVECEILCVPPSYVLPSQPSPNTGICHEPMSTRGRCNMNLERWTYNKRTGICEYFKYGGCGASGNIFEDWVECEILCVPPSYVFPSGSNFANRQMMMRNTDHERPELWIPNYG